MFAVARAVATRSTWLRGPLMLISVTAWPDTVARGDRSW
jgi:hypothetical protein